MGEARAESLLVDVGEAVVGVTGESSKSGVGTPGGGVAHRSSLLEGDSDAAGGERGGALISHAVAPQTVSEEQSGDGERSGVSRSTLTRA